MGTETVIHEGRRVFAQGKGAWRTIAELYAYFAFAGLVLPLLRDASFALSFTFAGIGATVFAVMILVASLGRVRITPSEVRVSLWRGTTVVPRAQIAEVVHIKDLQVMGSIKGYVALLDHTGKPLWRSATNAWTPETVEALTKVGQRWSVVGQLSSVEAAQRWPGMLPWSLANPKKAFWVSVAGTLVFFALLALFFWWLFSGPLA